MDRLFLLTVVVPTTLAVLYFGLFASGVYVSESRFIVRSPDKPASSGLGGLLKSAGFSTAGDEIFAAHEYVQSRDALKALKGIARSFAPMATAEFRYLTVSIRSADGTFEDLYDYYPQKVRVHYRATSGITALTVRAYSPQDAQRFNRQCSNALRSCQPAQQPRARRLGSVRYARGRRSENAARQAALALARFRNARGIIDPEKQATVQLQMVSKLQDELIGARTSFSSFAHGSGKSADPDARGADRQPVAGNRRAIGPGCRRTAIAVGHRRPVSAASAGARIRRPASGRCHESLEEARNEARRKQAYVERIVQPSLPDEAEEPRRLRGILPRSSSASSLGRS